MPNTTDTLRKALEVARQYVKLQNRAEGIFDGFGGRKPRPSDADLKMIDEALAASTPAAEAAAKVPEWLPIATAPRDGRSLILLLTPSGWPQVAWSNAWWTSGFSVENKPLGWAPIPHPPQENTNV